ncbi:hypothetical protein NEOC65_001520 [Neochlamydia sp. AcF65]|nr:hypothetical protein [Neochlamydia sp. AcF65]MBS4169331.1 hypothetical protein [Neochlamydia sp. AcF95]
MLAYRIFLKPVRIRKHAYIMANELKMIGWAQWRRNTYTAPYQFLAGN